MTVTTTGSLERLLALAPQEDPVDLLREAGEHARALGAAQFEARSEEATRNVLGVHEGVLARLDARPEAGLAILVRLPTGAEGFATTTEWSRRAARDIAERAIRGARAVRHPGALPPERPGLRLDLDPRVREHPRDAGLDARVDLLKRAEAALEGAGDVKKREVLWGEWFGERVTWTSDARLVRYRPLHCALEVRATVGEGARLGMGRDVYASCAGLEHFAGENAPERIAEAALSDARESARAEPMPAGRFPAVLDPHIAGVLAHESFGHMSEFDCVEAGWSVLGGRRGERLGPEGVTITDSGSCEFGADGPRGVWVPVDEEASLAEDVTILQDGALNAFMHNRRTAAEEGSGASARGNGRALAAGHPALVRMRNTFFEAGDRSLDELLSELKNGYYVSGSTGGEPSSDGSFVYTAFRAYRVEDGELKTPLRGVTLLGNILEYLPRIRALGRDVDVRSMFFGGCGKWGQNDLPVGIGGPHILFDEVLFGGERA